MEYIDFYYKETANNVIATRIAENTVDPYTSV